MKKKKANSARNKKIIIAVAVVVVIIAILVLLSLRPVKNYAEKYAGANLDVEVEGMERTGTYKQYVLKYPNAAKPNQTVEVNLGSYQVTGTGDVTTYTGEKAVAGAILTDVGSIVTWNVNVPQAGFYNIYLEYLLPKSHGISAERSLQINGEQPFLDAKNLAFTRIWTNNGEKKIDNQGNEIRPSQMEIFDWQNTWLQDDRGYIAQPYMFYFNAGNNTITLGSENEPMAIKKLALTPVLDRPTYDQYYNTMYTSHNPGSTSDTAKNYLKVIQGEDSTIRSESSLYAKYDRSSPSTQPNSVTTTVLNYIGGESWNINGQWIEWSFDVPEDGFYNLTVKARQNYSRGNVSNRKIYIDGEVPFKEMEQVSFAYDNEWEVKTLGKDEENPYYFWLEKGTHTIRLEATMGDLGDILQQIEDSTFRLNQIYRKILVYTGVSPDQYRDYHIEKVYPQVIEAMELEMKRLYKIVDDYVAYSGQKAENIAPAQTLAQQLERFIEKPQKITVEFTTFKDNITSLGTSTLNLTSTKLDVDYLVVNGINTEPESDSENFITKAWHEVKSFVASFFVDYNSVGDVYNDGEVLKVWVTTGRDQGTILKTMIDDSFTPETGIPVNVEIVMAGSLLNAVMANRGPDVVLSVGSDQPVNYALRGAAEDITQFADWQEVLNPDTFTESSYEQYKLVDENGHTGIYGLPETQTFNVMFYRKDILQELGFVYTEADPETQDPTTGIKVGDAKPPKTWKEVIEMLPTIQGNNLSVGIPSAAGSSSTGTASTAVMSTSPDLSLYFTLLYQYGGDMYNERGTKTIVNDEAGMAAFDMYVRFFNDYGLPTIYDATTRFRQGEMPIIVSPYSLYNTLMVSAPEIRGLWDFTLVPGTIRTDENGEEYIDYSAFIAGSSTMMIATDNEKIKADGWEFMKWWVSEETQTRFGREIEALLGASARYATANRKAFKNLSWSAENVKVLDEAWSHTKGIREVPGGYFTGRHIANAVRKVINDRDDTRETIIDYSRLIDDEIVRKRNEFGLPSYGDY
ncbi:MAG: extracellular solute-binding protein [Lachnospiraceae bacterium]|nr:extracellular solute-binding protein [Lachnospiraceae bacterium]